MSAPTTHEKLVKLAEKWEREASIALGNSEVLHRDKAEAEMCRAAHGYLLHCAGELRDAIGEPRVLDERAERARASRLCAERLRLDS